MKLYVCERWKKQILHVLSFSRGLWWLHSPKDARHSTEEGGAHAAAVWDGRKPCGREDTNLWAWAGGLEAWEAGFLLSDEEPSACLHPVQPRGSLKLQGASHLRGTQRSYNIQHPSGSLSCRPTSPGGPQTKPNWLPSWFNPAHGWVSGKPPAHLPLCRMAKASGLGGPSGCPLPLNILTGVGTTSWS